MKSFVLALKYFLNFVAVIFGFFLVGVPFELIVGQIQPDQADAILQSVLWDAAVPGVIYLSAVSLMNYFFYRWIEKRSRFTEFIIIGCLQLAVILLAISIYASAYYSQWKYEG